MPTTHIKPKAIAIISGTPNQKAAINPSQLTSSIGVTKIPPEIINDKIK
jgi:hypothetical protein